MNGVLERVEFKDILKQLVTAAWSTQKELSEQSGISMPTLSRYLSGLRVPDHDSENVARLAAALFARGKEYFSTRDIGEEDIREEG